MPLRSWRSPAVSTRPTRSPARRCSARAAASPASRIGILEAGPARVLRRCTRQARSTTPRWSVPSALGAELIEVDLAPFLVAAELLYAGPWVAERTAAVGEFLAARPDAFWPTTRAVIETGRRFSAVDAFTGQYRLAELARAAAAGLGEGRRPAAADDAHDLPRRRAGGRADPAQQPAGHLHQFRQPARPVRAGAARRASARTACRWASR